MMTVYILKCKPDHDQLPFANYCIFFLTCLAFWIRRVYNTGTINTGAGKFGVTEKLIFCDCLNSLEDIVLPGMVNLTHLVHQADLTKH